MTADISVKPWRALIAVNTCEREPYLRRYLPLLASATASDERLSVIVSLDGNDTATQHFCERWAVPLIISAQREGVGISKNRVLESHPDYDYYFFLEDDVEVFDGGVFASHVGLAHALGLHHMSLFEQRGVRRQISETVILGQRVAHCLYGGADFNFFTREGLERVGGWHPAFAKYRRWGHTEHSYRFVNAGLARAPFNVAVSMTNLCIWHAPPSVTQIHDMAMDDDQLSQPERELINASLEHVPIEAPGTYRTNGLPPGPLRSLASAVTGDERYPLLTAPERREAQSDYLLWLAQTRPGALHRAHLALRAWLHWPQNPAIRHELKMMLTR